MFVCVWWCTAHIVLCFCFVCLRLLYPMLPVSLDCPLLIALSVFSNVYLSKGSRVILAIIVDNVVNERFEDTKGVIRGRKSKIPKG